MHTPQELQQNFWKAVKSDRTLMLGVDGVEDGHSRPMTAVIEGETGPIWFFTGKPNAVAYGAESTAITVTSEIVSGEFSIAVHNHGPVIPAAVLPTLFQPMVRGTDIASASRSVGLGLFIVSEIAKAHGGEVRVESTDADGTTFTAVIPRSA
jgi:light-regulated signal transduction histidine kinase (bacteriophytochrome)